MIHPYNEYCVAIKNNNINSSIQQYKTYTQQYKIISKTYSGDRGKEKNCAYNMISYVITKGTTCILCISRMIQKISMLPPGESPGSKMKGLHDMFLHSKDFMYSGPVNNTGPLICGFFSTKHLLQEARVG